MNCFTIPADKPFISTLAGWMLEAYGEDLVSLPKVLILLPNRRSCRSLREAFLEITHGKPLLLPRIQPIGDVEEPFSLHYDSIKADIPPPIPAVRREFLLMKLVMDFKKNQSGLFNVEQAAMLARQLARFMDEVARFGLNFDRLEQLVPDDLAIHWQQTLDFLHIISHQWPKILEQEGFIDPIDHRNRILLATVQAWQKHPPEFPIIAAGSTGSTPATAALLSMVAQLPQGKVILPALDTDMPEAEWNGISETHPQFGLKQLLETMGCERRGVKESFSDTSLHPRLHCLRAVLQSPGITSGWARLSLPLAEGLQGIRLLTAETLHDEARMIAIALREVLEIPGKTAALVTPDRTLARMVASQMLRFGVNVDDSAGHPLIGAPSASLMRLLVDMVANRASPVSLLALLRHPLSAAGRPTAECRTLSRVFEVELLRGLRRAAGLEVLHGAAVHTGIKSLLQAMSEHLRPMFNCFEKKSISFRTLLEAHIACSQWLVDTGTGDGYNSLWAGEGGNRLAELLAELLENADLIGDIDPTNYPELFDTLLFGHSYYPRFSLHPRLHILSPMEARLQHFDTVILGGLNEGAWPQPSEIDPWMSRPMRKNFKMPPQERAIGQSAHDMYLLCAAKEVLLTRSQKIDGTSTIPSRWLVRLETLVKGLDAAFYHSMRANDYYESAKRILDAPDPLLPLLRPQPKPPLAKRPRKLRVTAIDEWLADPYRLYAKTILNLRKLPELDQDPDAADFGNLVHKTMEQFVICWPSVLPDNPLEELLACGHATFADMFVFPSVASLWWPRFETIAAWIIKEEIARRGYIQKIMAEVNGRWDFDVDGKLFTLTTRIDRLEITLDGIMILADYKTGSVPTISEIEGGKKNQLLLEALIAMHGILEPAIEKPIIIGGLEYWRLSGRSDDTKIMKVDTTHIESARIRLENLIRLYDSENHAYAPPANALAQSERYNDYAHLTRRKEWGGV